MPVPIIEARGLTKKYGDSLILNNISLRAEKGETVAIIGASGSGKSTLCRILAGIEPFTSGEVLIDGGTMLKVEEGSRRALIGDNYPEMRKSLGMVFQHYTLFPQLTLLDNVRLAPRRVLRLSKGEATDRAMDALRAVGLAGKRGSYPSGLSGGQKQRGAIARELAMARSILLFDEVTSALDPELVREVLDVLSELAVRGLTMIVVTHEMRFALKVADRVIFLDNGVIEEEGPSEEVLSRPRSERTRRFLDMVTE
jgi:ABC-type polar amino acid transport system ATPase subunit